jgi:hypothetical protein
MVVRLCVEVVVMPALEEVAKADAPATPTIVNANKKTRGFIIILFVFSAAAVIRNKTLQHLD